MIGNELNKLPNFIRYFCMMECNDTQEIISCDIISGAQQKITKSNFCWSTIKNIINHKNTLSDYKMCHYGANPIGILVMKYYNLGCIDNYDWNETNFDILKNVIKQTIYAILYAYETKGFIHGDLHSGNILLKPKRNNNIIYGEKILPIDVLEVVIMDFEKSKLNQINKADLLFKNIDKFITSVINSNNMKLNIFYNTSKLVKFKSVFNDNIDYYNELDIIINEMYI